MNEEIVRLLEAQIDALNLLSGILERIEEALNQAARESHEKENEEI